LSARRGSRSRHHHRGGWTPRARTRCRWPWIEAQAPQCELHCPVRPDRTGRRLAC
jgi:hypothetical protein